MWTSLYLFWNQVLLLISEPLVLCICTVSPTAKFVLIFWFGVCVFMCAMAFVWRSEDNIQELVLSYHGFIPGVEFRLLGLQDKHCTSWASSPYLKTICYGNALHFAKQHLLAPFSTTVLLHHTCSSQSCSFFSRTLINSLVFQVLSIFPNSHSKRCHT